MALTPEDVVQKRFETTRFRDGYDQDEVDDFLDEVVTELRRLIEENDTLKARVAELEAQPAPAAETAAPSATETPEAEATEPAQAEAAAQPEAAAQSESAAQAEPAAQPAPVAETAPSADGQANSLIALATRLHDEHVAAGEAKRDELIAAAETTARQIEDDAQQRKTVLQQEFEQEKAKLEQQKVQLESKIDELKSFERDYRLKLRGYIESQLRDLDRSSSLAFGGQPSNG